MVGAVGQERVEDRRWEIPLREDGGCSQLDRAYETLLGGLEYWAYERRPRRLEVLLDDDLSFGLGHVVVNSFCSIFSFFDCCNNE